MNEHSGIQFLNKVFKDLYNSEIVRHTSKVSDNKLDKISKYMERLERVTNKAIENDRLELLLSFYYDKYIIKKEMIPESYFQHQEQVALERGYGHVHYSEKEKEQEIHNIINEQRESLKLWLEYFVSEETNYYPMWFKYYVFQGVVKIGSYDKASQKFTKRNEHTVKPFIELNREAVAMLYSEMSTLFSYGELDDDSLEKLIENGNFQKIYAYIVTKLDNIKKSKVDSDDGIWKKYLRNSKPEILYNDIKGKGTGWCTAGGIETAKTHIDGGDFYVYYTLDIEGNYTVPRIAIRMEGNKIAEIRGISENQNLEGEMEKVVEEKLKEFPDADKYKKKVHDMELLTIIYNKYKNNLELSIEELRFLYEIDDRILGFGYDADPRINEIKSSRDIKGDLSIIFNCKEENISLTEGDALSGNIIYHYGNLELPSLVSAEGVNFPKHVRGGLDLSGLTTVKGLILPESINGSLYLKNLTSAKNLKLPKYVGTYLDLSGLTTAEGLTLPDSAGCLLLGKLTSAKGLKLPKYVGWYLDLSGLITVEGVNFPEHIEGSINLSNLTSAEGLILPEKIGGGLHLNNLTSAEGLKLPEFIGGYLELFKLTTAKGLILPKHIEGNLYLNGLTSAEGLILPDGFPLERLIVQDNVMEELLMQREMNGIKR